MAAKANLMPLHCHTNTAALLHDRNPVEAINKMDIGFA
jgi:hypothetical protein